MVKGDPLIWGSYGIMFVKYRVPATQNRKEKTASANVFLQLQLLLFLWKHLCLSCPLRFFCVIFKCNFLNGARCKWIYFIVCEPVYYKTCHGWYANVCNLYLQESICLFALEAYLRLIITWVCYTTEGKQFSKANGK